MDESGFVDFLRRNFPARFSSGIGDDTSVAWTGKDYQLIGQDILVEGVHFRRDLISLEQLAAKALAVNLSDIAAMGGTPRSCYLGLGWPPDLSEADLQVFFQALKKACRRWRVELAGGDFSSSPLIFISVTVEGRADRPVLRSGAGKDDLIAVTCRPGESALGLRLLSAGRGLPRFSRAHLAPMPHLRQGRLLADYATAMIDLSDGLLLDLGRLLQASGRGALIEYEKIPRSGLFRAAVAAGAYDEKELVLAGGEDYGLLFTLPPDRLAALAAEKMWFRVIGRIGGKGLRVREKGRLFEPPARGYDHFKQGQSKREIANED